MSTPLTDSINALTTYANEVTGASDTTLSDAVHTLASGYGGGSATLIAKTITENGTYSAEDDDADGYSSVTVNVPSSGSSGWTKVCENTYTASTTATGTQALATWSTGHSELWQSDKWVYIRIRDIAGKRAGYFYGSDQFFTTPIVKNGQTGTTGYTFGRFMLAYSSAGKYITSADSGTTGYGVYADRIYQEGRIQLRMRYNSTNSLTVDGTYKVEVYLLDPAGGVPIFE